MENQRNRALLTVTGILTAVVITFSQFFYYQGVEFCKKEVKTEKHEKKTPKQQETHISIPSNSVLSSVHFDFSNKVVLLFEITFEEKEQERLPAEIPISLGKYFQTLFHIIISPNAP